MADIGFNRQTTNYYEDWLDGDGVPGSSFTLSYCPISIDDVSILTLRKGRPPKRTRITYDEDAAGETKYTLGGSGNKTLTMGSKIVVATDQVVIVRYWAYGVGYNVDLDAIEVVEHIERERTVGGPYSCSAAGASFSVPAVDNFELIFWGLRFIPGGVDPTIQLMFQPADGAVYDLTLRERTAVGNIDDWIFIGGAGYDFDSDDTIMCSISAVGASVYSTTIYKKNG